MKKILMIAYYFPPRPAIGAQRPAKLAKYLPRFGWEPIVLTAALPGKGPRGLRILETPYDDVLRSLRTLSGWWKGRNGRQEQTQVSQEKGDNVGRGRLLQAVRDIVAFPDDSRGWYRYAVQAGEDLLGREKIDAIVSTSFPVTAHLIARRLKREFGIPWIADLRDLWTQNHYLRKNGLIRYYEKRLELKTFADADLLVTVSDPWAESLRGLHRHTPVACVTNGFDKDDFTGGPEPRTSDFTITHTGILYNGRRDPSLLFGAVSDLFQDGELDRRITRIRFVGCDEAWLRQMIDRYNLGDVVSVCGTLPREEALRRQRESQLLLLLRWDHPAEEGMHTAKIFEYLAARRPVLATGGPGGVVEELLDTTGSGRFAGDRAALKAALLEYYREYLRNGDIEWRGNGRVEDYSHESIARRYAGLLDGLLTDSGRVTA